MGCLHKPIPEMDSSNLGVDKMSSNLYEAHRQWANRPKDERFENVNDLIAMLRHRRDIARSYNTQLAKIQVEPSGDDLVITNEGHKLEFTNWSFQQLCSSINAPSSYIRTLPSNIASECLNETKEQKIKKLIEEREPSNKFQNKLLTLAFDNSDVMQAMTSTSYGRIYDVEVAETVRHLLDVTGNRFYNPKDWSGKPSGLYASRSFSDLFMFFIDGGSIVDGGTDRSQLHRGFFVWNSEVGKATFGMKLFLFNYVCGNHIVWNVSDVVNLKIKHSKYAPYRFINDTAPILKELSSQSVKPIEETIRKANQYVVPQKLEMLYDFGKKQGFTKGEVRQGWEYAIREEKKCESLWDFVQGLTASARDIEFMDSRVDLETRAGKLLDLVECTDVAKSNGLVQ